MSVWTGGELKSIERATEVTVASERGDGTLRPAVTVWGVRLADDVYVRSAHGPDNGWFRRARTAGVGRLTGGVVSREVSFELADAEDDVLHAALDEAYHRKYDRYGASIVGTVVGPGVVVATLRVVPRE